MFVCLHKDISLVLFPLMSNPMFNYFTQGLMVTHVVWCTSTAQATIELVLSYSCFRKLAVCLVPHLVFVVIWESKILMLHDTCFRSGDLIEEALLRVALSITSGQSACGVMSIGLQSQLLRAFLCTWRKKISWTPSMMCTYSAFILCIFLASTRH